MTNDQAMTPRPIHKWKSLWLGIFILISLGWVSIRSFEHLSLVQVRTPDHGRFFFSLFNGQAALSRNPLYLGSWHFDVVDQPAAVDPYLVGIWRELPASDNTIVLSHAYIIALFLLPWSTFLLWRRHHVKHHLPPS